MNILLLGATGMVGSRIAAEALGRGHNVTAVSRSGDVPVAGVTPAAADVSDVQRLAELAGGHDAVASALAPPRDGSDPVKPFLSLNQALVAGVRGAGVARLVVVGGAGSLEVAPGEALVDQPGFPDAYRGEALAHRDVLAFLRTVDDLDWTYISPAAEIGPGERTEEFRIGGDRLMMDADGESRISAEDYALAFVDEIERDAHSRKRMSVAY
ncbi:NAD(P)-dependent oxidoreductase [Streptomyces endophyticus]|uniref:NAD(P)-dependent oxidoreductase n=1 Tax=Streptomyces endophyticus TaxID=714166 RepID=A0ABU6FJA7_9ACTN|nr:NAD(P)-dependent oxidoreductase [Streptomyces endophyticus]MEB8344136.1 NAD(P)-dependent oxidoreductase [Streptomyces endophyticus]